jgi:hypothetical protein
MEEKTGNGEQGVGSHNPAIRVKEAIRTLQGELLEMHMTIGILAHELSLKRKEQLKYYHEKNRSKEKKRSKNKDEKQSESYLDEDS